METVAKLMFLLWVTLLAILVVKCFWLRIVYAAARFKELRKKQNRRRNHELGIV